MEKIVHNISIDYNTELGVKAKPNQFYIEKKKSGYISFKNLFEYIIALVSTILVLPLLLIIAVLIKIDSKGPIFFKQIRYGLSGKPFLIYKFRTMIDGAHSLQSRFNHLNEMDGGRLFKSDKDPRITKLGRFLRKTSIDEFAQLLNILRGEMSIIGPRPISTPLSDYDQEDLIRFKVKPGLGCIWQAYFRKETDFKTWMKTDAIYVENVSFWLDNKLFFTILINVLKRKGAR